MKLFSKDVADMLKGWGEYETPKIFSDEELDVDESENN